MIKNHEEFHGILMDVVNNAHTLSKTSSECPIEYWWIVIRELRAACDALEQEVLTEPSSEMRGDHAGYLIAYHGIEKGKK